MKHKFGLAVFCTLLLGCASTEVNKRYELQSPLISLEADKEFQRAVALAELGEQDQVDEIILKLAERGYAPALNVWKPDVACKRISRTRNSEPHWSIEKLAMQGDKNAIYQYWDCVNDTSGYDVDIKAGLFLLEHLANHGDRRALDELIEYYLSYAKNSGIGSFPSAGRIYEPEALRCGNSCSVRHPDPVKLAHWINRYQHFAEKEYSDENPSLYLWATNYVRPSILLGNYFVHLKDYEKAAQWFQRGISATEEVDSWQLTTKSSTSDQRDYARKKLDAIRSLKSGVQIEF
ncbi:hypothetical protein QSX70_003561 [Vibrio metoecus]